MFVVQAVAAHVDDGGEGDADLFVRWWDAGDAWAALDMFYMEGEGTKIQPVNDFVVREAEDELVYHAIDADSPGNELESRVFGIIEDKVVAVEVR